jgi:CheY-like chemotaxis protein
VTGRPLDGLRILIVEDEFLVALDLERIVEEAGGTVVGPVAVLGEALDKARAEPLNGAILDVNIAGKKITPVAAALRERGVPFILSTGYGPQGLDPDLAEAPSLRKPFDERQVAALMTQVFLGR